MKILPAVINNIKIEYENANSGFFNDKIQDIEPINTNFKSNLIMAKYMNGCDVEGFKRYEVLIINTEFKRWDGCIYAFRFRGHLLVRKLQFFPFKNKYSDKKGYKSIGANFDEYFNADEVDFFGIVVGKITEYGGGLFETPLYM